MISKVKKIATWLLVAFFLLSAVVAIPSFASLLLVLASVLLMPITKLQAQRNKYLKKKWANILTVILFITALATFPTDSSPNSPSGPSMSTPTTLPSTAPTQPTQPSTAPTQSTTQPTQPTTAPTQPTTQPTQPTTAPTQSATQPTQPTEPAKAGIVFISHPITVGRNENATVKIKGVPDTGYSISVYYKSGLATAEGLEYKISDKDGYVSWTWKIGGNTSAGTFNITVSGGGDKQTVKFTVVTE